eukprot:scaffold27314_cov42-Phaeocystis_antarctica.AAC.1
MSALSLALRQSACPIGEERLRAPKSWRAHTESNPMQPTRVCCSHLPHVHPRQPRLDRVEAVGPRARQRPLKGLLLRRAHHHVERRAADLGVVDLLDAVGALERLRVVPRLQQQHSVPDGANAVAEPLQVGAHVGLPDH